VTRIQRCIETGALPPATNIHAAIRLLFAPVIGLAALRLSNRLAPQEDPDALVRQAIDVTLAGFKAVPPAGNDPRGESVDSSCPSER
jgi:hypothetical protein